MDSSDAAGYVFSSSLLPTPAQTEQLMQLLRSNALPLPHQSSHLDSAIASSLPDLARYDAEIHMLQKALARMASERAALQQYIDGCRSISSAVRRLPAEILTEIFALCSPEPVPFHDPREVIPDDFSDRVSQLHLLQLSQVCSSWYGIVMGTPRLWTTIAVVAASSKIDPIDIEFLSRSLERSDRCPLAIHCVGSTHIAGEGLEMLAQHSRRWRTADIYLNAASVEFFSNAKGNVPLLERLEIGGFTRPGYPIFETAPKLMHVTLASLLGELPKLPWSQLRRVVYECAYSRRDIRHVLEIMPLLSRTCMLNVCNLHLSFSTADIPFVISNIPILHLSLDDASDCSAPHLVLGELLAALTLPCLKQLSLCSSAYGPILWPRDHFPAFASRSSFRDTLTKLFLRHMIITEGELLECLSQTQALSELFIQDVPSESLDEVDHVLITDSLFQHLIWVSDTSSCLVPNLNHFIFASIFSFGDHPFLNFVTSRIDPGRTGQGPFTVQIFHYPIGHDLGVSAVAQLSEWEQQGQLRWSVKEIKELPLEFT
ncbi:hypothetical protein B0H19DRAFT_1029674 [Mycena capillaripes]|nr:hypothetical protein B0H19DRAFT_1029674 [Mycena capillaripes]